LIFLMKRKFKQVMANYSTNINKIKQTDLTSSHWTLKRPWHMVLEIQVLSWDRHKYVCVGWGYGGGLSWLIGSQPSPSDNLVSNDNTIINKQ